MNYIKSLLLSVFIFIINLNTNAQLHGKVVEKESNYPVAFATVIYENDKKQKFENADVYGNFTITENGNIKEITVSCVGYKRKVFTIDVQKNNKLLLDIEKDTVTIGEVVVKKDNNPAIRIIKNALKNKIQNDFENIKDYNYTCYFKTLLDVKRDNNKILTDSATEKLNRYIEKLAALITEVVAINTKVYDKEHSTIIATKTSSIKSTVVAQSFFEGFHHSISFYANSIPLFKTMTEDKMQTTYLSPLSNDCLTAYSYYLENTYTQGNDSIFEITFSPQKDTKFSSLRGKMQINSNGFAIQSIVVEPNEKGLINFRFKQDYTFIHGRWFPSQLDEEIGFTELKLPHVEAYLVYLISSHNDSVSFNKTNELKKKDTNVSIVLDNQKIGHSDSILSVWRKESLTKRELNTYHIMDSIGNKHHFDTYVNLVAQVAAKNLAIGIFDIDISRFYTYNNHEGNRIGLGLYTNDALCSWFSIGGYIAQGLKDRQTKYAGNLVLNLNKANDVKLKFTYLNDIKENGIDLIDNYKDISSSSYLRSYIGYRYDKIIESNAAFSFTFFRYASFSSSIHLRKLQTTYAYKFNDEWISSYRADECRFNLTYAYGREYSIATGTKLKTYKGNPIVNITYSKGLNWFNTSSYKYNKVVSFIEYTAYKGRIGQSDIRLEGGFIDSQLPVGLLFTGEGSKNNEQIFSIRNSFQTMKPYEFISNKYASLFYQHNFGSLLFTSKSFKPQFVIAHNMGIGSLLHPQYQQEIDFKIKDKLYVESGLIINDIFRYKILNTIYLGAGVGVFYRYGEYAMKQPYNNTALKLSITVSYK